MGILRSPREFIDEIEQFIFKTKHKRLYVRFEILKYLAEAILVKDGRDTAENYVKEAIQRYGMTPRVCTVRILPALGCTNLIELAFYSSTQV